MSKLVKKSVEEWLNTVDYSTNPNYVPTEFALEFVSFIKSVNAGTGGEENLTPIMHYHMLDSIVGRRKNIANLCHRGAAKTSVLAEYLFLFIAVTGGIPGFGSVSFALYVSDSIENGVKNMRKNLEHRWENSEFLQYYLPKDGMRLTDVRYQFTNLDGKKFVVRGYGAKALSLSTKLYTLNGYTTIGNCEVGDKIFGADGKLTTITKKSEVFNKPMYKITLIDGRELEVSEDHINPIMVRGVEKNYTTLEALKLPNSSKTPLKIRNIEPIEYQCKELFDPYTLGLLLGDGSLKKDGSCVLHTHRDDWRTYEGNIPYQLGSHYLDKRNHTVLSVSIIGISRQILDLGLNVHGDCKFIPEEYFTASIEQRKSLLQGLMDTDGSCYKNGRTVFSSNSKILCEGVLKLVYSLGGSGSLTSTTKTHYKVNIALNLPMFRLPRKLNRQCFNKRVSVSIVSIERIKNKPSQCIAVDNLEHQFIAGEYFRTHNTGVRGAKEMGQRPTLAIMDDLISDEDARSPTVISSIEDTVHKAVNFALHSKRSKRIWSGTPFNARDPLYKVVESGSWHVNVYPVCEKFPCTREEFRGSWEDRFDYEYVKDQYDTALALGQIDSFNQELMLRIMSDEDRLITDNDIKWYSVDMLLKARSNFNFYITTDFATNEETASDYSVISVWALNNNGDWFLVDAIIQRQLMDRNIDDLFKMVSRYKPQEVGIEVSGQQRGFLTWIKKEMLVRNIFFNLTKTGTKEGIQPTTDKMTRFNVVVPWFKAGKMYFPKEAKKTQPMMEALEELGLATVKGFKSKHDDFIDTVSMLALLNSWKPSYSSPYLEDTPRSSEPEPPSPWGMYGDYDTDFMDYEEDSPMQSYVR